MNLSNRFLLMSSQQDENLKERVIKNTNQSGPASAGGVVPSKTTAHSRSNSEHQIFNSDETPNWLKERLKQQAEKLASKK